MPIIIPDASWYESKSLERNTPASCPYANVHKCPRYYASIQRLGEARIISSISDEKQSSLDVFWASSELMPVIAEEETCVYGEQGSWSTFSNFCPEVTFTYLHYYASFLAKYVDEIDSNCGRRIAEREKKANDWRYEWGFISPCHFSECSIYNKIHDFNSKITNASKLFFPKHNQVFVQQFISQEISMSDQYNVTGQVGAVGPNAKAENNTFNQIMQQAASNLDLPSLTAELAALRKSMRSQATEVEHDLAVASIGAAENAAKRQDGVGALEHLKSAGKWALEVATKIGAPVAAKAIQTAIGL